jgi:hypothetical protein
MKMKFTKIMMVAAACLALTAGTTMAQGGRLSIGVEFAQPLGNFKDGANTGFGGSLRYEYPMGDKLGLTFTAGYISFGGKDQDIGGQTVKGPSVGILPLQAGLKFYFNEQQNGLYVMAEVGAHSASFGSVNGYTPKSHTSFSYAPEIGFHMAKLDFGLRYQFFSLESADATTGTTSTQTEGYIGLRAAFVLGGK